MKTLKKTFYIGLFDKDEKKLIRDWNILRKEVEGLVCEHFKYGGTLKDSSGIFKHSDGAVVREPSVVVTVFTDEGHLDFISDVKDNLNQESVIVQIEEVNIDFL